MYYFLPGEVSADLGQYDDTQLAGTAALLRQFHDANASFTLVLKQGAEVMCHNDWSHTNTVFRNEIPCGTIGFDTAAPGFEIWAIRPSLGWTWATTTTAAHSKPAA